MTSSFYVWDDDGTKGCGRLGLKVYSSKNKIFVFRYYRDAERAFIQLGRFPQLSLLDAREKAKEKEAYPFIDRQTKAKDVTTQDCINILAHMIRRGAPTQSNRVRSYLMAAFNHGLRHDHDPANYLQEAKFSLTFNPV